MPSFSATLAGLVAVYVTLITTVYCAKINEQGLSKSEIISLTRDHFGRTDPDELLNGFFPVWAVIQLLIACFFLVIAVLSLVCYALGCRTPESERMKRAT